MDQKGKGNRCYFCGDPSTSQEHIPPEQIFVGFNCSEIKVPSCRLHNEGKSRFDDCIVKGFLWAIQGLQEQGLMMPHEVHPNVLRVLERAKKHFPQVKKDVQFTEIFLEGENPNRPGVKGVQIDARIDVGSWIKKLTAGLIWNATQEFHPELDWVDKCDVYTTFFASNFDPSRKMKREEWDKFIEGAERIVDQLESRNWYPGWSAFPNPYPSELYNFRIGYSIRSGTLWFYHRFFRLFKLFVGVKATIQIAEKIAIHSQAMEIVRSRILAGDFVLRNP